MSLDEHLLSEAHAAATRVAAAERAVRVAAADHRSAVRRLHDAGGTLREMAPVLRLSHQRVHQLVSRGERLPVTHCGFCGRTEQDADRLLSGLDGRICAGCVARAAQLVATGEDPEAGHPRLHLEPVGRRACSFCGAAPARSAHVVTGVDGRVCPTCLDACGEALAGR